MKIYKKLCLVAVALTCAVINYSGCANGFGSNSAAEVKEADVSYDSISRMAYIGGSLVYNSGNIGYGQLYNGVKIAVRTSLVESENQDVTAYAGSSEYTKTIKNYSDKADSITFGYLTVTEVSKEGISFYYTKYDSDGTTAGSSNYTVKAGESVDITGDGKADLKYSALVPVRNDFENAMILSFISSTDDLYTTMYATIKTDNPSRAAIETSLYGLNTNNEFIYIVGIVDSQSRAVTSSETIPGISHGDYVISEISGEYYTAVGNNSSSGYDLKSVDDYTGNENEFFSELEPFLTYFYTDEQFASDTGAVILLKKMPESLWGNLSESLKNNTCTQEEAVDKLNEILVDLSSIYAIIDKDDSSISISDEERNDFEEAQKDFILSLFPGLTDEQLNDEEKFEEYLKKNNQDYSDLVDLKNVSTKYLTLVAMSRRFIENHFPESPRAIAEIPDVTLVFPLLSMDLGDVPAPDEISDLPDISTYNPSGNYSSESESRNLYSVGSRAAETDYESYLSKKEKIDNDFSKFHSMSLTKIKIQDGKSEGKDKPKTDVIFMKKYNTDLKLGVIGNIDIRWGKVDCEVAGAVYLSIGANLSQASYYNTIFKKDFMEISTTMMVGPVPITTSLDGDFKIDLNIVASTPINCALGYTGMYGAGVNFGANYGVSYKWKWFVPVPYGYFDPYFNSYTINNTAYYAGRVDQKQDDFSKSLEKFYIEFIPTITVKPGVKLGPKYVFAGVELPVELKAQPGFGFFAENKLDEARKDWWCVGPEIYNNFYFCDRLILGTSISISPVIGVKIPVINKNVQTTWKAVTLLDAQCALTDNGFQYKTKFFK